MQRMCKKMVNHQRKSGAGAITARMQYKLAPLTQMVKWSRAHQSTSHTSKGRRHITSIPDAACVWWHSVRDPHRIVGWARKNHVSSDSIPVVWSQCTKEKRMIAIILMKKIVNHRLILDWYCYTRWIESLLNHYSDAPTMRPPDLFLFYMR